MRLRTAFIVMEYLAKRGMAKLVQPTFAQPDFFLFTRIKMELKDHYFGTLKAVKETTKRCLNEALVKAFQGTFNTWKKRCLGVSIWKKSTLQNFT